MPQAHLAGHSGQGAEQGALSRLEGLHGRRAPGGGKGSPQRREAERGPDQALELAVIGLKPVVEVLGLTVLHALGEAPLLLQGGAAGPWLAALSALIAVGRSEALSPRGALLGKRLAALAFRVGERWTSTVCPSVPMARQRQAWRPRSVASASPTRRLVERGRRQCQHGRRSIVGHAAAFIGRASRGRSSEAQDDGSETAPHRRCVSSCSSATKHLKAQHQGRLVELGLTGG